MQRAIIVVACIMGSGVWFSSVIKTDLICLFYNPSAHLYTSLLHDSNCIFYGILHKRCIKMCIFYGCFCLCPLLRLYIFFGIGHIFLVMIQYIIKYVSFMVMHLSWNRWLKMNLLWMFLECPTTENMPLLWLCIHHGKRHKIWIFYVFFVYGPLHKKICIFL